MDAVLLARIQFAFTIGFHFLFPPVTIGMAWLIVGMLGRWRRTGDELDERLSRFWIRIFAITFALGVATGITMEFQFGTNWAAYSRFVGDVFGAPLAAEGIFAFFLESTFLGVLLFGFGRFSRRTLWFAGLMVAVGATLSGFWIIVANSWMQTPAGFALVGGRAELTDFWAAVFNPSTLPRYLHTIVAALMTGSFFVLGIAAVMLLRRRHEDVARPSLRVALVVAFVATVLQLGVGHWHGMQVAATQPAKAAAMEAHFETQRRAPLVVFGVPDEEAETVHGEIAVPGLLSWMAFADTDAEVTGLRDIPRDEWPPVTVSFVSFRLMLAAWAWMLAVATLGMLLLWRRRAYDSRPFLWAAALSIPMPLLANELGWLLAEVGRQPWTVYGVLRTSEAVSPNVSAGEILFSLVLFGLIYALLGFLWIHLLRRTVAKGPPAPAAPDGASPPDRAAGNAEPPPESAPEAGGAP